MTPAKLTTWIDDVRGQLERIFPTGTTRPADELLVLLDDSWRAATELGRMKSAAPAFQRKMAEQVARLWAHLVAATASAGNSPGG
jgi:hypothetical protein